MRKCKNCLGPSRSHTCPDCRALRKLLTRLLDDGPKQEKQLERYDIARRVEIHRGRTAGIRLGR